MADYGPATWMTDSWDDLKQKTLKELVIPGSHNAGMGPDVIAWSRSQNNNTKDQMTQCGVRFLDIRPGWDGDDVYTYHGSIQGETITGIVNNIKEFISTTEKEIVIVSLANFRNIEGHEEVLWERFEEIKDLLIPCRMFDELQKRLADATLEELLSYGRVILATEPLPSQNYTEYAWRLTKSGFEHKDTDYNYGLAISDNWSNTTDMCFLKSDQAQKYNTFKRNGESKFHDIFLLSWTLSPAWYFASNAADEPNPFLEAFLSQEIAIPNTNDNGETYYPNILFLDAVDTVDLVRLCLVLMGCFCGYFDNISDAERVANEEKERYGTGNSIKIIISNRTDQPLVVKDVIIWKGVMQYFPAKMIPQGMYAPAFQHHPDGEALATTGALAFDCEDGTTLAAGFECPHSILYSNKTYCKHFDTWDHNSESNMDKSELYGLLVDDGASKTTASYSNKIVMEAEIESGSSPFVRITLFAAGN